MAKQKTTTNIQSDFFTLAELTRSDTAKRLCINNTPTTEVTENLQYGADMVLDPLRRLYAAPIIITSGYRCPKLNKAVGGVSNSWHQLGNAADIRISSEDEGKKLMKLLQQIPSVDTALFEHSPHSTWLHVQWDKSKTPRHHFNFNYHAQK